ncbi:MAG TPA: hypothetical protein VJC01_02235 [Candidatus Paceibacterota bacterium]
MSQLNLKPNDQIPEVKKRSIDALSVIVLAVFVFLIFGGLIYGANKISDFKKIIKEGINQGDFQNVVFQKNSNINSVRKNINQSSASVNSVNNQATLNVNNIKKIQNDCVDSDAGSGPNDIYIKGATLLISAAGQTTEAFDSCRDQSTVEEVRCLYNASDQNVYLQRIPTPCPKGCGDGACKR